MFQALFFQERDATRDLRAHKQEDAQKQLKVKAPPAIPRSPKIGRRVSPQEVNVRRHPTQNNLIGGKVGPSQRVISLLASMLFI